MAHPAAGRPEGRGTARTTAGLIRARVEKSARRERSGPPILWCTTVILDIFWKMLNNKVRPTGESNPSRRDTIGWTPGRGWRRMSPRQS